MTKAERINIISTYLVKVILVDPDLKTNNPRAFNSIVLPLSAQSIFDLMNSDPDTFEIIARGVRNAYFDGVHDGRHELIGEIQTLF